MSRPLHPGAAMQSQPSRHLALVIVLVPLLAAASPGLPRHLSAPGDLASHEAKILGPTANGEAVRATLALHQPGAGEAAAFIAHLAQTQAGPSQYLSATEIGRRFGLPDPGLEKVVRWIGEHGLQVINVPPQRTTIPISGSAEEMGRAFDTSFEDVLENGSIFHRPTRHVAVPSDLVGLVDAVADLTNRPPNAPARVIRNGEATPSDLTAAYDIKPLYDAKLTGDGTFVAIVSFCTHTAEDITHFQASIPGRPSQTGAILNIRVADPKCADDDGYASKVGEVSSDIEIVSAIAPGATILNFEGEYKDSQSDVIDAIVTDGRAKIATDSWGRCWNDVKPEDRAAGLTSLSAALLHGVNVFVASGDWGAYDCYSNDASRHELSVDWPSSSIYTISVGGTALDVREDGAYWSERAWGDYLGVGGSGGGLVPAVPRPAWQIGTGVLNQYSNGMRQVPDVSATASGESPYALYFGASPAKPDWQDMRGTSLSSPFWAGVMALIEEHASIAHLAWPLDLHPMLYDVAASSPGAFHDVTKGSNLYYPATPGWDFATGLGSPDAARLDAAILKYLGKQ